MANRALFKILKVVEVVNRIIMSVSIGIIVIGPISCLFGLWTIMDLGRIGFISPAFGILFSAFWLFGLIEVLIKRKLKKGDILSEAMVETFLWFLEPIKPRPVKKEPCSG